MYKMDEHQMTVYDYVTPYEELLDQNNRWLRLAKAVDWEALEQEYSANFGVSGKRAMPVRLAFGVLVVRDALGLSDRETVRVIGESPYLQYFVGVELFDPRPCCVPATLAKFRRRIPAERIEEAVAQLRRFSKSKE